MKMDAWTVEWKVDLSDLWMVVLKADNWVATKAGCLGYCLVVQMVKRKAVLMVE